MRNLILIMVGSMVTFGAWALDARPRVETAWNPTVAVNVRSLGGESLVLAPSLVAPGDAVA